MRWLRREWWRDADGRAFAREFVLIVLGVLVALGIGEIADTVRWRIRVHQATAAMRQESAGNRFNVVERALYTPCIERRLAEIDLILRDAWRTRRLPPIAAVGAPGARIVETAAFDIANADGTPLHMDRGDARDIAIVYGLATRNFTESAAAERDLWATLSMLEQPGGVVDGNVLAMLTEARARAVRANEDVSRLAQQADQQLAAHEVPIEWGPYGDRAGLLRYVHGRPLCQPLVTR